MRLFQFFVNFLVLLQLVQFFNHLLFLMDFFHLIAYIFRVFDESNVKTQVLEAIVNEISKKFEVNDYFKGSYTLELISILFT